LELHRDLEQHQHHTHLQTTFFGQLQSPILLNSNNLNLVKMSTRHSRRLAAFAFEFHKFFLAEVHHLDDAVIRAAVWCRDGPSGSGLEPWQICKALDAYNDAFREREKTRQVARRFGRMWRHAIPSSGDFCNT
jgi:hypothetical protein